jgi:hypothetical protein
LKWVSCFVVLLPAGSGSAFAQRGALTSARGLDQLTQEAATIVQGYVTSAKVEPHPQFKNLMTVLVSLRVVETLKGTPQRSIQFRQYIWDLRDQLDAAGYTKGKEFLLMLGPVSAVGLTSPVGLEQGRFTISRDASGNLVAQNGRGNLRLLEPSTGRKGVKLSPRLGKLAQEHRAGPLPLSDLKDAIRSFARTN